MHFYETERSIKNDYVYVQKDNNLSFKHHIHTSYEFLYIEDGELILYLDDETFHLHKGQGTLILPNQIHAYSSPTYSKSILMVFSTSYVFSFYNKTKNLISTTPIFDYDATNDIEVISSKNINQYLFLSILYKIVYLYDSNASYIKKDTKQAGPISQILAYVEANSDNDISLKDAAYSLSYDYTYISKLVNDYLNMNFTSLVNINRICHATELIRNTDDSFANISIKCGYSSIRSFNRNFKKVTGTTPKEFRKNNNVI